MSTDPGGLPDFTGGGSAPPPEQGRPQHAPMHAAGAGPAGYGNPSTPEGPAGGAGSSGSGRRAWLWGLTGGCGCLSLAALVILAVSIPAITGSGEEAAPTSTWTHAAEASDYPELSDEEVDAARTRYVAMFDAMMDGDQEKTCREFVRDTIRIDRPITGQTMTWCKDTMDTIRATARSNGLHKGDLTADDVRVTPATDGSLKISSTQKLQGNAWRMRRAADGTWYAAT